MVIDDLRKGKVFVELKIGQVFEYDGDILIKIRPIYADHCTINAIDLQEGVERMIDNAAEIIPLTAKLIIE